MLKRLLVLKFSIAMVLFFTAFSFASAQPRTVTGNITDENGETLVGVNVVIKGTTTGTISDADGNYSITVPDDNAVLEFSFVGMTSQEIAVGNQTSVNVTMVLDVATLEEVIVVGYASQRKINLTGSVSTIESEDLVEIPSADLAETLVGKAPGLMTLTTKGVPGVDATLLSIRGYDSPLVLVDGIETDWTRIDPYEIASVSVLKDASAAIYGARAGNGVILITTKRGATDKPSITYSGSVSFQDPVLLPDLVDSWKYAELLREGEFNQSLAYTYTEEEIQKFKDGNDRDYPNTNWHEEVFRHWAPMFTHNLGVRGGNDQVQYYISAGYLDQASLYESGDLNFNRYNIRSNIDANISERLKVSFDIAYRKELRDQPQTDLVENWADTKMARPDYHPYLPDPELGASYSGFNVRQPIAQTMKKLTGFKDDRREFISGKINFEYKIPGIEGLSANARLNYLFKNTYLKTQDRPFEVYQYNYDTDSYDLIGTNGLNSLDEEYSKYQQLYPLVSLNYDRTFGDHSITGLALAEWIDTENIFNSSGKLNLLSLELPYLFAGSPDNVKANGYTTETGRSSYAGRLNYSYKGKYLLEGTIRIDQSHKFPKDTRLGVFPSVSAGWRISDESFMQGLSWMDNLKLRLSYSQSGLDDVEAFKYLTGYEVRTDVYPVDWYYLYIHGLRSMGTDLYIYGSDAYRMIRSTGLPNPDITWLDMTSYNVGLDGTFLNGLIGIEFDLFYRITENIFGTPLEQYPSTFGAILPQLNLNSTDDRGFEIVLSHRNRVSSDLFYSVEGSFSLGREKYRDWSEPVYDDPDEIRIFQKEGNYTNRRIGYISDGIFMDQAEIDNHPVDQDQTGNATLRPGDIKYNDLNGDGVLNWRDQDEIGYSEFPDATFSLNLGATYKGLSFSALFQGATLLDQYYKSGPLGNFVPPYEVHYKYRWQPDPANPTTNINPDARLPAMYGDGTGGSANSGKWSDFWIINSTYVRLRQLSLSYSLPGSLLNNIGIQNIQLSISGTNLLTFSALGIFKSATDPETDGAGNFYPPVKTFAFGLNITI